jgi:hypothetical protein
MQVTYLYPVSGLTPPTLLQDLILSEVVAQVQFADTDAGPASVTHNWGLSSASLAVGVPQVSITAVTLNGAVNPALSFTRTTNAVTISKGSTATGSGGTFEVVVNRHTIIK